MDFEGCLILRQIYAWHCIVLTSDNNTVHNNKEQRKTIRNLTMPCINLPKYYKCVFIWNPPREGGGGGLWILLWEYGFRDWILDFMPLYIFWIQRLCISDSYLLIPDSVF